MTDKKLEALFSELSEDEIMAFEETGVDMNCEIDDMTKRRIADKVRAKTGELNICKVKPKKRISWKIALIAAVIVIIFAVSTGAVYKFALSDGLVEEMNLEKIERIKTVVDTETLDEDSVQTVQKTVSANGFTVTFEAIVEGASLNKNYIHGSANDETGKDSQVARNYAIFSVTRDDGSSFFNNDKDPREFCDLGVVALVHGYEPSVSLFGNDIFIYEEENVLYIACDITEVYKFADHELSIAVCGYYSVDGTILRMDENGDFYFVDSYDDIHALFNFDIEDEYADVEAQKADIAARPYDYNTDPDYAWADEIIAKDEAFKNSGIDLSYAIGNHKWKGSYPLQFGEVEHAEDFIELYKSRDTLNAAGTDKLLTIAQELFDKLDPLGTEFIENKTGKAYDDITDKEIAELSDEFDAYIIENDHFLKSDLTDDFKLVKFADGSEYVYLDNGWFLYFPANDENAKLIFVAGSGIVISFEGSSTNICNIGWNNFPINRNFLYPGYIEDIWYLEGGVDENSLYAEFYEEEQYNAYVNTIKNSDTDAIYSIVKSFSNYEGTVQVFN